MAKPIIARDPEVMGGTPVLAGTRVPVQTLLDYIEAGESIDDFLAGFPMVNRQQVVRGLGELQSLSMARHGDQGQRRVTSMERPGNNAGRNVSPTR
jgi:uncharacterized protein (DUF433 family)